MPRRSLRRRGAAPVVVIVAAVAAGCTSARPTAASLGREPVLAPLPAEVVLAEVRVAPRADRIGVPGRDGVVERVVAVDLLPAAAADLVLARSGARYGFRRVDLGVGTPVTVELRGTAPTGAQVVVTSSTAAPVLLYGSPDDVRPTPPDRPTTVVITVVSRQ
ncbi:MAG: hypothetical protein ABIY58_02710 [Acidimicrobiales bacterium]